MQDEISRSKQASLWPTQNDNNLSTYRRSPAFVCQLGDWKQSLSHSEFFHSCAETQLTRLRSPYENEQKVEPSESAFQDRVGSGIALYDLFAPRSRQI